MYMIRLSIFIYIHIYIYIYIYKGALLACDKNLERALDWIFSRDDLDQAVAEVVKVYIYIHEYVYIYVYIHIYMNI
jgi:hypothetical protein